MTSPARQRRSPPELDSIRPDLQALADYGSAAPAEVLDDLGGIASFWLDQGRFQPGFDLAELFGAPAVRRDDDPRARRRELLRRLAERKFPRRRPSGQARAIETLVRQGAREPELIELEQLAQQSKVRWPVSARWLYEIVK